MYILVTESSQRMPQEEAWVNDNANLAAPEALILDLPGYTFIGRRAIMHVAAGVDEYRVWIRPHHTNNRRLQEAKVQGQQITDLLERLRELADRTNVKFKCLVAECLGSCKELGDGGWLMWQLQHQVVKSCDDFLELRRSAHIGTV